MKGLEERPEWTEEFVEIRDREYRQVIKVRGG
jgi:hypothetical protein